ncbi:MAG: hypothetical protein PHE25_04035 [Candidatus Gracilibacteria bacterium]|nr:hypothetical protein [Candidatus Gracilibacteria bacterium]
MFSYYIKNNETNLASNGTLSKKIDIDENLSCFIIIDCKNKKILTPLLNKIVDFILDNIDYKDTYNKFSVTLESINFFIKNLKNKENDLEELNIIIGILEKNNFYFAKIGKSSCYLINNKKEIIEISDKNLKIDTFDFISSGKLTNNDKIILSNINLNEVLTQSDLNDISKIEDCEKISENITHILNDEKVEMNVNIIILNFEANSITQEKSQTFERAKDLFYRTFDNNFSKKAIAIYMILKEKLEQKGKIVKNIVFFGGIILSTFLLYSIISGVIGKSIESSKNTEYKNNLIQAREYIRIANQNIANPEAFNLNIKKAEDLIVKVKDEQLFLNDVESIQSDISIIKKQFNGIEIFDSNTNNLIFKGNFKDSFKLIDLNNKLYAIGKGSIYGPIISGQEIKNNTFNELAIDDEFVDGTSSGDEIIITTKKSRVISFFKNGTFKYLNVLGQKTWEGSNIIESYNGNLYMLNNNGTQIYKHTPSLGAYSAGVQYLNEGDSKNLGKILTIGIDGGIYILNNELKLFKFFSSPKYRLESIVLNKLPDNYLFDGGKINLITRNNLNYLYLFLNNKIWIFEPNTKNYSDTKSLTYIGQIEGKDEIIKGFYIPRDGEINILTENGIYKINFEAKDGKIIVR